jgi:hypothetical protein
LGNSRAAIEQGLCVTSVVSLRANISDSTPIWAPHNLRQGYPGGCEPLTPSEIDRPLDNCGKVFDHVPSAGMSVALAFMVIGSAFLNRATSLGALFAGDMRPRSFRETPPFTQMSMKPTRGSPRRHVAN